MTEDVHERARKLIDAWHVEGLPESDRAGLETHLAACPECAARAQATERALQSLRTLAPRLNPAIVAQARLRVRVRAQELREYHSRLHALWISCALSWILGALTAPLLWQGVQWIAERFALSTAASVTLFVLSWSVPAAAAAAVLVWWRSQTATENGFLPPRT